MSLGSALAPTHNVLVCHSPELPPQQVRCVAECYGVVLDISSYHLVDNTDLVSIVQYRDPESVVLCYESLKAHMSQKGSPVKKVAWVHAKTTSEILHKSYIRCPYKEEDTAPTNHAHGFLVAYLGELEDTVRSQFLCSVKADTNAVDFFVDTEYKGRCFLHYPTVEAAEETRRGFSMCHPSLRRAIHHCDEADYFNARKKQLQVDR
ncbi:uncharacterized protein TEOVI_000299100 [Trypanosoma equiperdum]|uniref:Uncharacterized protein n=1 Tax=Trypanosoma equiperdum TaxID=5694 RepID=A0A1G4IGB0_TRYEQ|nr:hypothetical protein, conserved [Trypanosoma equiperdum]